MVMWRISCLAAALALCRSVVVAENSVAVGMPDENCNVIRFVKTLRTGASDIPPILFELEQRQTNKTFACKKKLSPRVCLVRSQEKPYKDAFQFESLVMTAVRDPLSRLMSHYYYTNSNYRTMSFNDWYELHSKDDHEPTPQELGWGGRPHGLDEYLSRKMGYGDVDLDMITKQGLRDRYVHIFIQNRVKESMQVFHRKFGVKTRDLRRLNTGRDSVGRGAGSVPAAINDLFKKRNPRDEKVFKLANEILDEDLKKSDEELRAEVERVERKCTPLCDPENSNCYIHGRDNPNNEEL
jgi:hypothetical protein